MILRKLFVALLLVSFVGRASAQDPASFAGNWVGKIDLGVELRLVFHITQAGNGGAATMDSPDQSAFGIPCDSVMIAGNRIALRLIQLQISYEGVLINDSTIEGNFIQGKSFPMVLKKSDRSMVRARPQTPKPPFPYKSIDVSYENSDKTIHYGATLTLPAGTGPFPAILLITGSGPQDRDETLFGHKPFAVLADAITRDGFAVLRVDDRGVEETTGDFSTATSIDFATDAAAGVDYLRSIPEVNTRKIGLMGHSEGGMIAPIVAANRKDIAFLVLLAGPGIPISQLMAEQNAAILLSSGTTQTAVNAYLPLYKNLMAAITTARDSTAGIIAGTRLLNDWAQETDSSVQRELGIATPEVRAEMIRSMTKTFSGAWYHYFLSFDPRPYLQKLRCPVLALNGSKDIQVISTSNLAGIRSALKKSRSKDYTVEEVPGLNHLFQTCKTCGLKEYAELEETFSPAALNIIREWLNKHVKE